MTDNSKPVSLKQLRMSFGRFAAGTLAYTVCVFALAILWHLVLFAETYKTINYIGRAEPLFEFGLLSIFTQAVVINGAVWHFGKRHANAIIIGLGVYHWSCHVVAATAKNQIDLIGLFFALETCYLSIQFLIARVVVHLIH